MTDTEIWVGIVIPILTSIVGGLIGGLFTFLGVKLTIKNEKDLKKIEICERVKEKNEKIIANRPEFKVVEDDKFKEEFSVYLLPYAKAKLIDKEKIRFDYSSLNLKDEKFWDFYEVIIKNTGKRAIETGFLQLEYKSGVNIYNKYDFQCWETYPWTKGYYCDIQLIPHWIHPDEQVKLKVYFPKKYPQLKNLHINAYLYDEDGNHWYQDVVNISVNGNKSEIVDGDEYTINYRQDSNQWFIYDHLYYCDDVEKCFNTKDFPDFLDKRKRKIWDMEEKWRKFKIAVRTGEEELKKKA